VERMELTNAYSIEQISDIESVIDLRVARALGIAYPVGSAARERGDFD